MRANNLIRNGLRLSAAVFKYKRALLLYHPVALPPSLIPLTMYSNLKQTEFMYYIPSYNLVYYVCRTLYHQSSVQFAQHIKY